MIPVHPVLQQWMDLSESLALAAGAGARHVQSALRPRRSAAYRTRRPGVESPMWNVYATMLRRAARPYGTKSRLARYLGIPPQRLSDFLTGRRLPDAELTLRMLHWLTELRAGRDMSL